MTVRTIGEIPGRAAARFGGKTALIFGGRAVSFAEIDRLSSRVASGLRALGVEAGDRVTLYAQNSVEWIVSYYAVARAGGVVNPVNVMLTRTRSPTWSRTAAPRCCSPPPTGRRRSCR